MAFRDFETEKAILNSFIDKVEAYITQYEHAVMSLERLDKYDEKTQELFKRERIGNEAILEDMARRIDREINRIKYASGWDALYADIMATKEEEENDIETIRNRQGY